MTRSKRQTCCLGVMAAHGPVRGRFTDVQGSPGPRLNSSSASRLPPPPVPSIRENSADISLASKARGRDCGVGWDQGVREAEEVAWLLIVLGGGWHGAVKMCGNVSDLSEGKGLADGCD